MDGGGHKTKINARQPKKYKNLHTNGNWIRARGEALLFTCYVHVYCKNQNLHNNCYILQFSYRYFILIIISRYILWLMRYILWVMTFYALTSLYLYFIAGSPIYLFLVFRGLDHYYMQGSCVFRFLYSS